LLRIFPPFCSHLPACLDDHGGEAEPEEQGGQSGQHGVLKAGREPGEVGEHEYHARQLLRPVRLLQWLKKIYYSRGFKWPIL
jgi:hypothetical protein